MHGMHGQILCERVAAHQRTTVHLVDMRPTPSPPKILESKAQKLCLRTVSGLVGQDGIRGVWSYDDLAPAGRTSVRRS